MNSLVTLDFAPDMLQEQNKLTKNIARMLSQNSNAYTCIVVVRVVKIVITTNINDNTVLVISNADF